MTNMGEIETEWGDGNRVYKTMIGARQKWCVIRKWRKERKLMLRGDL
jgi:hypothetical protein